MVPYAEERRRPCDGSLQENCCGQLHNNIVNLSCLHCSKRHYRLVQNAWVPLKIQAATWIEGSCNPSRYLDRGELSVQLACSLRGQPASAHTLLSQRPARHCTQPASSAADGGWLRCKDHRQRGCRRCVELSSLSPIWVQKAPVHPFLRAAGSKLRLQWE